MWCPFINELAGGKAQYLCPIKLAILIILNALNGSVRHGKVGVTDKAVHAVAFPAIPLGIDQQSQAFFKPKLPVGRIGQLVFQLNGHSAHLHSPEHIHRRLVHHFRSPPLRK